jgi:hypothetical protein
MANKMKWFFLILMMLCGPGLARAQQKQVLSVAATSCTVSGTSCLINSVDPSVGGVTFTVTANASGNTLQFEATGDGGTTWVAFNVTPSNSSTAASSTTSTGTWQGNVAGYTHVRIRMSTLAGGTSTVSIISSFASARAGGGGGGGGGTVTSASCGNLVNVFTCAVATATTTPAFSFTPVTTGPVLDCSQFAGADMGAKLNACLAALPAAGGIADATKFTSPQTISTAVVNSFPAMIYSCGIAITQTAAITLSGTGASWYACPSQITTITKGANIDQITLTGTGSSVQYVSQVGAKASFTGNGIVLNGTSLYVGHNAVSGEANDDILSSSALRSGDVIEDNALSTWGVHAYEGNDNSAYFQRNRAIGDGTATGAAIIGNGCPNIVSNYVRDSNATFLVDDSGCGSSGTFISQNNLQQAGGWPAVKMGGLSNLTNNNINGGGANGAAVIGFGVISGNSFVVSASDAIDIGNLTVASNNNITLTTAAVSGLCAINIAGDVVDATVSQNIISLTDTTNGDLNYGVCVTPTGTHSLGNIVSYNQVQATNSGTAISIGYFFNNAANLNTNVGNLWVGNACLHTIGTGAFCLKRVDTQNNINTYKDFLVTDTVFDAGTGSTQDIFDISTFNVTFANLPTPAGVGSRIYCTNCQPTTPAVAGGSGAMLTRTVSLVSGSSATNWTGNQSIVGQDVHTAEITGNYAAVNLIASTAPTGSYLVTIYTEISTGVATSTIVASIAFADDTGAQTQNGVLVSGATAGTVQSLTFPVRFVTGTALSYSTSTANSPRYKIIGTAVTQ